MRHLQKTRECQFFRRGYDDLCVCGLRSRLVRHVRTLHESRFPASLAHERDAYGVKHGLAIIMFHLHHLTVVARVFHRRRDADERGVLHQKQGSCASLRQNI